MKSAWPYLVIAAVAMLIWAPTLLIVRPGDSFGYDLNWSAQFTQLVQAGHPYPRWTGASFEGLGSPTFYFYPPLGFWAASAIAFVNHGWASTALQLKLAELAFFAFPGSTMFAWLRLQTGPARALAGACAFMIAPYHFDDHYLRGAFAEFVAIAFVPLVGFGLAKTSRGGRFGPVWLAASWGALIFSHLPIALLTGVLMIVPYALFIVWDRQGGRLVFLGKIAVALAAGTGLAAIYLIPALGLQGFISAEYWWSARFQVEHRLFANPEAWRQPLEPFLAALSFAEAALALVVGWRVWKARDRGALYWSTSAAILFLIMTGLVPGFWSLPLMSKVQFPWRAMALQEFALITLLACAPPRAVAGLPLIFAAVVAGNLSAVVKDLATGPTGQDRRPGYGVTSFPTAIDAPEYLPAGMLRMTADGPAPAVDFGKLRALPLASGDGVLARGDPVSGAVAIRLPAGPGHPIVLRRFYFPSWRARCDGADIAVAPTGPARLVAFVSPPGAKACQAEIAATSQEREGGLIGLVSLALIGAYGLWAARMAVADRRLASRGPQARD